MSALRPVAAVALLLSACGTTAATPTTATDPIRATALAFAVDADRALDGTRFEDVPTGDLADALVGLCTTDLTVGEAIGELGAPPVEGGGVEIAREVLLEGMAQVCPTRSDDAAAVDAFLSAVRDAITSTNLAFDDDQVAVAGASACGALGGGMGPAEAVLVAAAALYGVEASTVEGLAISNDQGVALGAVLASAATFLCPEHRRAVLEYVAGL